jgi:hypothetical protein
MGGVVKQLEKGEFVHVASCGDLPQALQPGAIPQRLLAR